MNIPPMLVQWKVESKARARAGAGAKDPNITFNVINFFVCKKIELYENTYPN